MQAKLMHSTPPSFNGIVLCQAGEEGAGQTKEGEAVTNRSATYAALDTAKSVFLCGWQG